MSMHRYGPHRAQFGELTRPDGTSRGTVVVVHGGFWRARYDLSLGRPLAADLAARGYTAWNLEYRRVGDGGGWPTTFADIAAGIDLLADLEVDTSRVVAIGHSAGGHLATWAAGRHTLPATAPGAGPRVELTGVVSQAGVLDLVRCATERTGGTAAIDLMGGSPTDRPGEYRLADPAAAIPLPVPVLCVHARADEYVPFAQSADYVASAQRAGGDAELLEVDGDHFTVIDASATAWQSIVDVLPRLLGR
ncbi:MAG TPA: alpha/beta fold hydrolase [Jatrophihabitans sp.]|jgi:acetyl esterase/lipase